MATQGIIEPADDSMVKNLRKEKIPQPEELTELSEEFVRPEEEMEEQAVNLANQTNVSNVNQGSTVSLPNSVNNTNPTFNIINSTRVV